MKLYKDLCYPERKVEIKELSIVDILTMDERSAIRQSYYNRELRSLRAIDFAINYAWLQGDCSPVLRGFQSGKSLYEIKADTQELIKKPISGNLFYDSDKIDNNEYVFKGTLDEFIFEFLKQGYKLK